MASPVRPPADAGVVGGGQKVSACPAAGVVVACGETRRDCYHW